MCVWILQLSGVKQHVWRALWPRICAAGARKAAGLESHCRAGFSAVFRYTASAPGPDAMLMLLTAAATRAAGGGRSGGALTLRRWAGWRAQGLSSTSGRAMAEQAGKEGAAGEAAETAGGWFKVRRRRCLLRSAPPSAGPAARLPSSLAAVDALDTDSTWPHTPRRTLLAPNCGCWWRRGWVWRRSTRAPALRLTGTTRARASEVSGVGVVWCGCGFL